MKAGLQQSTQLKQELKINPRLYQAMDLLYMPLLDLQQHLKQELLNNPFLDMVEPEEEEDETEEEAADMLAIIQGLDPPGVGARDLRECLMLQLKEAGLEQSVPFRLVRDCFDELINHRWSEISKRFGISPADVQKAADEIAKLDPKPGLIYSDAGDNYIIPDLIVQKIDGKYHIFLNDANLPRLKLSKAYQEIARDKKKFEGENKAFT